VYAYIEKPEGMGWGSGGAGRISLEGFVYKPSGPLQACNGTVSPFTTVLTPNGNFGLCHYCT